MTRTDWFTSENQWERFAGRTLEEQKHTGSAWKTLFADIQAQKHMGAHAPEVQAVVDRWDSLIEEARPPRATLPWRRVSTPPISILAAHRITPAN
ncbi:MAG: hypothetical protein KJ064_26875 [Anaerolineae bacterium]|nr:hypothetical protein [Anaerolineae bacterium]